VVTFCAALDKLRLPYDRLYEAGHNVRLRAVASEVLERLGTEFAVTDEELFAIASRAKRLSGSKRCTASMPISRAKRRGGRRLNSSRLRAGPGVSRQNVRRAVLGNVGVQIFQNCCPCAVSGAAQPDDIRVTRKFQKGHFLTRLEMISTNEGSCAVITGNMEQARADIFRIF
jgi:hypothetical protein